MNENGKAIAEKLSEVFDKLSEAKKEYFLGYADGAADMMRREEDAQRPAEERGAIG